MEKNIGFLLIACCILTFQISGVCASNPSPEQLVAEHLKSIGNPTTISQIKSVVLTGNAAVNFIIGATGIPNQRGTFTVVSQGPKIGIAMNFPDKHNYPGEHFAYDGKNVTVANYTIGRKSNLADFIHQYNKIMKNGILGGVISNAWPLLYTKSNKANMKVRKTKYSGAEVYELEYRPRDYHGDMKIRMYFDTETCRHLHTEYRVQTMNSGTVGTLVESFGDFRKTGDLTLPHRYSLNFSVTQNVSTMARFNANWVMENLEWGFNAPDIDQKFFNTEK